MTKLSIQAFVNILESKNWSRPQIAKTIGVTPYQVYLYSTGVTKTPGPKICMSIYKNINLEGEEVLINAYNSYEDLEQHYNVEVGDDSSM